MTGQKSNKVAGPYSSFPLLYISHRAGLHHSTHTHVRPHRTISAAARKRGQKRRSLQFFPSLVHRAGLHHSNHMHIRRTYPSLRYLHHPDVRATALLLFRNLVVARQAGLHHSNHTLVKLHLTIPTAPRYMSSPTPAKWESLQLLHVLIHAQKSAVTMQRLSVITHRTNDNLILYSMSEVPSK